MSLLSLIFGNKQKTASIAKERLQLILAHERGGRSRSPDYLPELQARLIDRRARLIRHLHARYGVTVYPHPRLGHVVVAGYPRGASDAASSRCWRGVGAFIS